MDISKEKKLRDNLNALINETTNEEEVLSILKQKNAITQAEFNDVSKAASPMGFKSQMYYLVLKKDDYAYHQLVEALKETENETCLGILNSSGSGSSSVAEASTPAEEEASSLPQIEVEVAVENAEDDVKSNISDNISTPDQEGIAIADQIEKELDRIESEDDSRASASEAEQFEETEAQLAPAPKPRKAVSFDKIPDEAEITVPQEEPPTVVAVNGFDTTLEGEPDPSQWKSIVATNREKFGGEGKFNKTAFAKRALSLEREEEPESQVKNLKNYFQRLSSVEKR